MIGAHPGALPHSELDVDGDKKTQGILYTHENYHTVPFLQFYKCRQVIENCHDFMSKWKVFFPVGKTDQRGMDCFPNAVNFLLREPLFTSREQICRLI